jgi:hypothetical protein
MANKETTRTSLASGKVTRADTLTVVLVEPPDAPAVILINWPAKPSLVDRIRCPSGTWRAPSCTSSPRRRWRSTRSAQEVAPRYDATIICPALAKLHDLV